MREIRFSNRAKETTLWLSAAFVVFLLYQTAHILTPFIWAVLATYIFHPLVTFMTRQTRVPRALWTILIHIAMFSLIAWTVVRIGPVIRDQTEALLAQGPEALEQTQRYLNNQPLLRSVGIELDLTQLEREVVERTEDNLIIPMLIGRVVHLNPVVVMFALLAGASVAGILGLLIAVPTASVLRILSQYLYTKVLNREPPYMVSISSTDNPVERVQEAVGAGAKPLVVVNVNENRALQEHDTFQQLARIISSEDLDVTFISSDAIARGLAHTHGMRPTANAI